MSQDTQQNNNNDKDIKPRRQRAYGHLRLLSWLLEFAAFVCVVSAIVIFVVNAITSLQQPEMLLGLGLIAAAILLHLTGDALGLLLKVYRRQRKIEYLLRLEIQREKRDWQRLAQQQAEADRRKTQSMLDENDYVLFQLEERKKSLREKS